MMTQTNPQQALLIIVQNMQQVLSSLQLMMETELQELMAAHPDSYRLQSLTEDKQAALNTLSYLDLRLAEAGQQHSLQAPYTDCGPLADLWQAVCRQLCVLQQANQHTGLRLQQRLRWTQQALSVLSPLSQRPFYGPDGYAE